MSPKVEVDPGVWSFPASDPPSSWTWEPPPQPQVVNDAAQSRYEIRVSGALAGYAKYELDGDVVLFTDTQIDPERRGQGLGQGLAREAIRDVLSQGKRPEARCEFIAAYLRKHPVEPR